MGNGIQMKTSCFTKEMWGELLSSERFPTSIMMRQRAGVGRPQLVQVGTGRDLVLGRRCTQH